MKSTTIAVTADIHYGTLVDRKGLEDYIDFLVQRNIDILVIAGDMASRGPHHRDFVEFLEILSAFPGRVMATPGNHDLWTRRGDSMELLRRELGEMMSHHGMILLDGNPQIAGNMGIVGSVGWYDYSFRHVPDEYVYLFRNIKFRIPNGKGGSAIKSWPELDARDYRHKSCEVSYDGSNWKRSTWQDFRFIRWDMDDYQALDFILNRLADDIEKIRPKVDRVMAVTHHLPFARFVPDIPDPVWSFHRAFLGSDEMGALLMSFPKVQYAFFGHNHRDWFEKIGHINARNLFYHRGPGTYYIQL